MAQKMPEKQKKYISNSSNDYKRFQYFQVFINIIRILCFYSMKSINNNIILNSSHVFNISLIEIYTSKLDQKVKLHSAVLQKQEKRSKGSDFYQCGARKLQPFPPIRTNFPESATFGRGQKANLKTPKPVIFKVQELRGKMTKNIYSLPQTIFRLFEGHSKIMGYIETKLVRSYG